jgi:ribosomal-protein-serine acetyltransferase
VGQIRRDQRRVLQEKRGVISPSCALEIGEGTCLRLLDEDDAPRLHSLIEANREALAQWLPWAGGQTQEDTVAFIRGTREQVAGNDGFQAAVVAGGEIAGVIGFTALDWEDRVTRLGYWLGAEFQGRGTMTEAARALTDHGLSAWGLNRVEIRAAPGNRPSRAIPERLGFTEEGTLRGAQRVGSRYLDTVVYSMLAEEWADRRPAG